MPIPVAPDAVLDALEKNQKQGGGRPLKAKDISRALGLSADDRSSVRNAIQRLVEDGRVVQLEGRRFVLPAQGSVLKGKVQRKASGSGWFIPDDPRRKDAFLPPQELSGVMDGDHVLCRVEEAPKGPVGKIVKVISRGRMLVTGVLHKTGRTSYVEVEGNVISGALIIPPGIEGNAETAPDGSVVEALVVEPPTNVTTAIGRIVRVLGKQGDIRVEIERIVAEKGAIRAFPPEVEDQAAGMGDEPSAADTMGRTDLRATALCTIDGETAKDFDDAVFGERRGDDLHVVVAIADVSHYVTAGSPLDVEAARRATSIYYPGAVIPMLPEKLSNGLCSLKPEVERLCMVADFVVTRKGELKKTKFYEGVMRSKARLTYTIVQKLIDGDAAAARAIPKDVQDSIACLREASIALRQARKDRGSMDFDLPETIIALDDVGEPVRIHPMERLYAHKLIEDLMVAANEAVASHFEERSWPCIYRIHEPPDDEKLERFLRLVRETTANARLLKLPKGKTPSPKDLGSLMDALAEHPAKQTLDSLLLRSMMQAKYSADNVGHYGLGSEAYLHFTSPIRRYPDLVVHRLLRERLRGKKPRGAEGEEELHLALGEVAQSCSDSERRATDIERSIDALYAAWFMRDKIGETFEGIVSSVAEFGVFVRLAEHHVEGMIRVQDLPRDYYEYDDVRLCLIGQNTGRKVTVGDKVTVRVAGVDLSRRQVGLTLPEVDATRVPPRPDDGPRRERSPEHPGRRPRGPVEADEGRGRGGRPAGRSTGRPAPAPAAAAGPKRLPRGPDELRAMVGTAPGKSRGGAGGSQKGRGKPAAGAGRAADAKGKAPRGGGGAKKGTPDRRRR